MRKDSQTKQPTNMKHSKSVVRCKFSCLPKLRFDDQQLTSYAGLVVFQQLFFDLGLKAKLGCCFPHRQISPIFSNASVIMLLIVHLLIGYRSLRHVRYYSNDPIVLRVLGLSKLPDVSTISRQLASLDDRTVSNLESLQQNMVLETIASEHLARVTLDFDGSVLGTCWRAQGVAIGFNRKKKGQRSYLSLPKLVLIETLDNSCPLPVWFVRCSRCLNRCSIQLLGSIRVAKPF